jgi:hypothetical protein
MAPAASFTARGLEEVEDLERYFSLLMSRCAEAPIVLFDMERFLAALAVPS